jgi:hypothetical protein
MNGETPKGLLENSALRETDPFTRLTASVASLFPKLINKIEFPFERQSPPALTSDTYSDAFNEVWRPVTALRSAATDDNPDTAADPNWLPEVGNTTPDPSYPGAHAVISASGAAVLISFFGRDHFEFAVTSEVMPGAQRSFTRISEAEEEATLSRICAGVHFRTDLTVGQRLGGEVANFVVDNFLTLVNDRDESDERK